jgi:hypothetical protein
MESALVVIAVVAFVGFALYKGVTDEPPPPNPQIVCPHCTSRGTVTTKAAVRKRGISGGKATGALFTGGLSMVATGLSRKQHMTQMRCSNCGTAWDVA